MSVEMSNLQNLLFGADGVNVSNFKLFPGSNREVTAEQIAAEIYRSINELVVSGAEGGLETVGN